MLMYSLGLLERKTLHFSWTSAVLELILIFFVMIIRFVIDGEC